MQRDGVTREGDPGELYDAGSDRADGKTFAERGGEDRHQFRFIVAPEDSDELAALKPFVRDLMRQMETDLGTRLDWVAVDHFNTGHPHSHIVVRGKDDHGKDLVIARDYIAHGIRARASELITRELGPESELEALRKLENEVSAERFTRLDRAILRDAGEGILRLAAKPERDPRRYAMRIGRLRTLEQMGLAEEAAPGVWRIMPEMEPALRRTGERGDIIETMHRDLTAAGIHRAAGDHVIFDGKSGAARVIGRLVAEGVSDELHDRRYVIVDGIDGRTHYADLGVRQATDEPLVRNTIVEVRAREVSPRDVDRTIANVAGRSRGVYLPRPLPMTGQVVEGLAKAGFFRMRGVLVGTVAYQCYSAVLGTRLDAVAMQTGDADFAQFHEISVAIKDSIPPILEVLRQVDPTFREIPSQADGRVSAQFVSRDKFKVEFLTPNQWSDDQAGKPVPMPALGGAAAIPLRFLDYLIYEPIRAVLLHGAGVPVLIPSPERYAIHKLIVGSRRKEDRDATAKSSKDRLQARSIIEAMIANRQHADLASSFTEAWDRGDHWRAAIRTSIATYDDDFQNSFRTELAKGVTELGSNPADYDLADKPTDASTLRPK